MGESRIQVWYLIGRLDVGGAERTLVDLANNLDQELFDATIWTIDKPGELAGDVEPHVSLKSLDASHKADLRAPLGFARTLRRESPDILQSFLFFDNTLARISGLASPGTTVITGVRAVPNDPSPFRERANRLLVGHSDHIVSNSEAGARFVISEWGARPDAVSVIHNGRDLDVYGSATAPPSLRADLGLPDEGPIVGTVGRLLERKGHYDLLDAWPRVLEDHSDAQLLIVGDGPERSGLLKRSHDLGIRSSVHLPGTRSDIPELLDLMDVFAFPSHFEGLPGALLEAMAAGLPIVTTPVDGNSELVEDEVSGLYVPVACPGALANRISRLLADPALGKELGSAAATVAQNEFALDTMVSQFEQLYAEIRET